MSAVSDNLKKVDGKIFQITREMLSLKHKETIFCKYCLIALFRILIYTIIEK